MLPNIKDLILAESKLLLLLTQLGMGTSSLCVLYRHLGCWDASVVCICPLKCWYTTLKWFCLLHTLHVLPIARHCGCMCTTSQDLHFSTLYSLFCSLGLCPLSWFASPFVHGQGLLCFSCHLMLFSALSALPLFGPT